MSDIFGTRANKTAYVVVDEQAWVGKFVVWRCHTGLPKDMEVWSAMNVPDGIAGANNCITVSQRGFCNSVLAGGHFDGDLNMISFAQTFLRLVEVTATAVDAWGLAKCASHYWTKMWHDANDARACNGSELAA